MPSRYIAFFSYTHADDEHDDGLLSNVRARLESELRLTLGDREVQIFQDRDDLNPGDVWEARLAKALDEAVYLIPVVTPSFFASDFCRREFMRFWEKAQADPKSARIIPLYWRTHFPLDGLLPGGNDPLLQAAQAIQYDDWRGVRPLGISDRLMRGKIEAMALDLALRHGQQSHLPGQSISSPAFIRVDAKAEQAKLDAERERLARQAEEERQKQRDRYRARGHIQIDARLIEGAPDGWFKPGNGSTEWFADIPGGPEMVVVPAGSFTMGSSPDEIAALKKEIPGNDWFDTEGPQHKVTFTQPFAIGRQAVTRGQFAAFVQATGHKLPDEAYTWEDEKVELRKGRSWRNPGFAQDDSHPVVCINWEDGTAFAKWLAGETGKPYRLPTEAEWEYAARAATTTPFWWGQSITTEQANYDGNYTFRGSPKGEYRKATVHVQTFAANPWGLYQVHGNVWEWCEDVWHKSYAGTPPVDGAAWTTGGDASLRVVRGGAWDYDPYFLRAPFRYGARQAARLSSFGLRLARTLPPSS